MGAGSIGCFVGARLMAADAADVTLVGRSRMAEQLHTHGMHIQDVGRSAATISPERITFSQTPESLQTCDVVLCCVKSAQTAEVGEQLARVAASEALVVSLQNGLSNAETLAERLPDNRVLAAIVGFNVVSRGDGVFHRGMSGPIALQRSNDVTAQALVSAFQASALDVSLPTDLKPHQWTKLLVNLNNAVSALSGAPTRELLLSPGFRRVIAAVIAEALSVLKAAGIKPAALRGIPVGLMPHVLRLPTPLVRLVTRAQMQVDPQARSSMWEDLNRRRTTEVDFLNGEIVKLAERVGVTAPLNQRITELVHAAEHQNQGSPKLAADVLWTRLHEPA